MSRGEHLGLSSDEALPFSMCWRLTTAPYRGLVKVIKASIKIGWAEMRAWIKPLVSTHGYSLDK